MDDNLKNAEEKIKQVLQSLAATLGKYISLSLEKIGYLSESEWKRIASEITKLKRGEAYYKAKKYSASLYKLWRGYQYLIGENYQSFIAYFEKMRKDNTKAAEILLLDEMIMETVAACEKCIEGGRLHPKLVEYLKIVEREILQNHSVLVFVRYVESNKIVTQLTNDIGVGAYSLFGQKYMKQKEQEKIITSFKNKEFPVLVATPIAHEGLHLPQVDTIIEYSVPLNEIEMKQRQGRCGREKPGEIWSLAMNHPVDGVLYFASRSKKQKMENGLAKRGVRPAKIKVAGFTSVINSPFSKNPNKSQGWVNSLVRGLIYERFCISSCDERSGEKKPYVSLILGDRTGVFKGYVWCREAKEAQEICAKIKPDDVVIVSGEVKKQDGYPILHIDLRKGTQFIEKCPEGDFILSNFRRDKICEPVMPWEKFETEINEVENNFLKELLKNIFQNPEIKEEFLNAPAAVFHHHNFQGGLAQHTYEMLNDFKATLPYLRDVNVDLARCGIILHDLGKIKTYQMGILAQKLPKEITIGHIAIGLEMIKAEIAKIDSFPLELAASLLHIIESHHGESGEIKPKTPEAILVSQIDDRNVKVFKSKK
jgi:3'-5' exoribonuclease